MRNDFEQAIQDSEPWRDRLIMSKNKPVSCIANCITILEEHEHWRHPETQEPILEYDEFAMHVTARKFPPAFATEPILQWNDQHDRLTADWMQRETGIISGVEIVGAAVQTVAQKRSYHPVRDYLNGLVWDGVPRIDTWLSNYLEVKPSAYSMAVGPKWLISAVARAISPGCKVSTCLILEGAQGVGKSTALKVLGGQWFTDDIADLGTKDSQLQSTRSWIIELSELDSMGRPEMSKVKAFMDRDIDKFRPPYGKHTLSFPRQCVYAGTCNFDNWLKDETGGRRWWPVKCKKKIDIPKLTRDRDQLWAEAVARFRADEDWWLDDAHEVLAKKETRKRLDTDAWHELVKGWLDGKPLTDGTLSERTDETSVSQVLTNCVKKDPDKWTQADKNRIVRVLVSLGWKKFRKRVGQRLEWRYKRA